MSALPDPEEDDEPGLLPPARKEPPISPLDELVAHTASLRSGAGVKALLDFLLRSPQLSLANATLLHVQNPEVGYVLPETTWKNRFARRVRPGARSYAIPQSEGAATRYFDVRDTEPLNPADDRVPPRVADPFPARSQPPEGMWETLLFLH